MFGHNEHHDDENDSAAVEPTADATLSTSDPSGLGGGDTGPVPPSDSPDPEPSTTPSDTDSPSDDTSSAPIVGNDTEPEVPSPSLPAPISNTPATAATDDLLDLKKDALEQLTPLVDHLDQSPEERFKTTMMMIQATDASGLIQNAYDAAKEISDEKVRAQSLLDIVNEINYFTHAGQAAAKTEE